MRNEMMAPSKVAVLRMKGRSQDKATEVIKLTNRIALSEIPVSRTFINTVRRQYVSHVW